jgi:hypothetical protein
LLCYYKIIIIRLIDIQYKFLIYFVHINLLFRILILFQTFHIIPYNTFLKLGSPIKHKQKLEMNKFEIHINQPIYQDFQPL